MSKVIVFTQTPTGEVKLSLPTQAALDEVVAALPTIKTVADLDAAPIRIFHAADWCVRENGNGRFLKITGIGKTRYQARAMADGTGDTFWYTDWDQPVYCRSFTG